MRAALLSALAAGLSLLPTSAQTSAIPGFISYQGRVTTSTGALVGAGTPVNRTVTFRIWNHATDSLASNLIYSEQQVATISEGEFSVLIGQGAATAGTPLGYSEATKGKPTVTIGDLGVFAGATRYLGVTVDDNTAAADPEISPRQQIVTSAFAFRAKYAESVGANGASTITTLDNGNVGIGTGNPSAKLEVSGSIAASGADTAGFTFRGTGDSDGGLFSPSDGIVTLRTDGTEKLRVNSAGNVGIGTTTPLTKLDVNGSISATPAGGYVFGGGDTDTGMFSAGDNLLTFKTGSVERMRVDNTGRVGIGVTPSYALHVRSATGEILLDKSDATGGAIYLGNTAHGLKRGWTSPHDVGMYTSGADLYLSANGGSTTSQFVLKNSGKVGIGTSSPTYSLDVISATPAVVIGTSGGSLGSLYFGNTGHGVTRNFNNNANNVGLFTTAGDVYLSANGSATSSHFVVKNSGNVGIGTSAPEAKLDVGGNSNGTVQAILARGADVNFRLMAQNQSSSNSPGAEIARFGVAYISTLDSGFMFRRGGGGTDGALGLVAGTAERVRITADGRVGIGNMSPIAPLHVSGSANTTFTLRAYMDANSVTAAPDTANTVLPHSIVADSRIRADAFDVSSDARIKNIIGRSAGDSDLATLQTIVITDYTLKDTVEGGTKTHKKVIAQQVEEVFPTAVGKSTSVIPDVFQKATTADGWVNLATTLKVGERVRLLADKQDGVHEVLEVQSDRFRTAFQPESGKVFVYGREVKDFRSVDYDAIAMLNVSATQQIKREKDAEVKALRDENAALRIRLGAQESRLAAIEQRLRVSDTAMARPAATNANGQE